MVDIATLTYDNSRKGREGMELLTAKMGHIHHENQASLAEIIHLGDASKEISKVMKIITAIADQTKLIAFNAALEAASAGETGRRFGVVAAEICRLADSVTESTGEIETKVTQIQDAIGRLVLTSEKGSRQHRRRQDRRTGHRRPAWTRWSTPRRQTTTAAQQISLSTHAAEDRRRPGPHRPARDRRRQPPQPPSPWGSCRTSAGPWPACRPNWTPWWTASG